MKILAFDQSSATGWACGSENTRAEFGRFKIPKRDVLEERLLIFSDSVADRISFYKPDMVVFEQPFFPINMPGVKTKGAVFDPGTIAFLQMLKGILLCECARAGVSTEEYASSSWRAVYLGYGRAPKGAPKTHMKEAVVRRCKMLGYAVQTHDEAEAIGILYAALHGPTASLRKQASLLDLARARL